METYYNPLDLEKFASVGDNASEFWKKFSDWYGSVMKEGELTAREKALIALAVAHSEKCPYCIDAYTKECLERGLNMEQMTEAVHVSAAIKGGAALAHAIQMKNTAKKVGF